MHRSPYVTHMCLLRLNGDLSGSTFGATTECRATLDHMFYMCQNLLKNEVENNRHYCDSIRRK